MVLAPDGTVRVALGTVDEPVFTRSSNKPAQLLGMMRAGLVLDDPADVAIGCASHSGEPVHVARVLDLLARHGLTEDDLLCPPAHPMDDTARDDTAAAGVPTRRAAMNCSGKHATMLATCVQLGWPIDGYDSPDHPLCEAVAVSIAELTGHTGERLVAVDGCGLPLFALTLVELALVYGRLIAAPVGTQPRLIADSMRAHPHLIGGTGRQDTELMTTLPGLLVKGGAEGVHGLALPDGTAVAIKIDDGAERARLPAVVAALFALGVFGDGDPPAELVGPPVLGGGVPVGLMRPTSALVETLSDALRG